MKKHVTVTMIDSLVDRADSEARRMMAVTGLPVSRADVVRLALMKWLDGRERKLSSTEEASS